MNHGLCGPLACQAVSPFVFFGPQSKTPLHSNEHRGGLGCKSLTMTYFHTGTRTIIGAKSFHCPVRDGKERYERANVKKQNMVPGCFREQAGKKKKKEIR